MAYNISGTSGNDTLDQPGNVGPGTIVGLAGNNSITVVTGAVTVDGGSGEDTVYLRTGTSGMVTGGTENDSIRAPSAIESMVLFGNEGADTIRTTGSDAPQTILGGNDSSDGSNSLDTGAGADLVFGNGGNDSIVTEGGADTMIGGVGSDSLYDQTTDASQLAWGNEGNDTIDIYGGSDTVFAGQGNDSVRQLEGTGQFFLNEGGDTLDGAANTSPLTVMGGNDSADGSDSIVTGLAADFVLGNGGNDTIKADTGNNTVVGGFGVDSIQGGANADLIWGNESDDRINTGGDGPDTVFAGQGNDTVLAGGGRDALFGNEGNDTIRGGTGIDTVTGGSGSDVFYYADADEDGENAAGGGPVELVTDVNFDQDRFQVFTPVAFAAHAGIGTATSLAAAIDIALGAVLALAGGGAQRVAAAFDFNGRSYLAIDQDGFYGFSDAYDLLIDVTGATGTINAGDFFV